MKRLAFIACTLAVFGACRSPDRGVAAAPKLNIDTARLASMRQQQQRCDEAAKRPVSLPEELEFGAHVALALASQLSPPAPGKQGRDLAEVQKNLNLLGKGLAAGSGRDIPWTFIAVESSSVVSFSAPGGFVFVTTALLERVENEAQLAGLLALHVAHVALKHRVEHLRELEKTVCIAASMQQHLDFKVAGALPFEVGELDAGFDFPRILRWLTHHVMTTALMSREVTPEEARRAARLAVELMALTGYDPAPAAAFLSALPPPPSPTTSDGGRYDSPFARLEASEFADAAREGANGLRVKTPPSPITKLLATAP